MEVELKLLLDPQLKDALLRHPLLAGEGSVTPEQHTIVDTYFDTPDLQLRRRHAGLRVRRVDGGWLQNIKTDGSAVGGLHARQEWESPVKGPQPQLNLLRHVVDDKRTRRQVLGAPALKKRLAPVFSTEVQRTSWDLHLAQGDDIACALDQGSIACGDAQVPVSELELELKSGNPAHLYELALALQHDFPLHLGPQSKADRGYALLRQGGQRAVKASPVELAPGMRTETAFQAIVGNCLAHIQGNEALVAAGEDVEGLHQMRVGMRRLRSALNMLDALLQLPAELQGELDWLATELGDARDWDVLAGATLPALAARMQEPARIGDVRQAAQERARGHHGLAAEAVNSPRYTRLMLNMSRWLLAKEWHGAQQVPASATLPALAEAVTAFARRTRKRNAQRLRRRARALRGAEPQVMHRFRIAAKKARYGAEFFASLTRKGATRAYIERLGALQDGFGRLNDAAVAARLLSELGAAQPELAEGAAYAQGFLAARLRRDQARALRLARKLSP